MLKTKRTLPVLLLAFAGCASPNRYVLDIQTNASQESTYSQGYQSITSSRESVVACHLLGDEFQAGKSWRIGISVQNNSRASFDFEEADIALFAVVGGKDYQVPTISYREFVASQSRAQGARVLGDLGTAFGLASTGDGSARDELERERTAQRQRASRERARQLDSLEAEAYLRRTTIQPGHGYGGLINFKRVSSNSGPIDMIRIHVDAGGEMHVFKYNVDTHR